MNELTAPINSWSANDVIQKWTILTDWNWCNQCLLFVFSLSTEYAAVGYIAKRIEMRKKRYQNLQKLAEQRRAAMAASGPDGETASTVAKSHVIISRFIRSFDSITWPTY